MIWFSTSTNTGFVNPKRRMLFSIWRIWRWLCVRALRGLGFSSAIDCKITVGFCKAEPPVTKDNWGCRRREFRSLYRRACARWRRTVFDRMVFFQRDANSIRRKGRSDSGCAPYDNAVDWGNTSPDERVQPSWAGIFCCPVSIPGNLQSFCGVRESGSCIMTR